MNRPPLLFHFRWSAIVWLLISVVAIPGNEARAADQPAGIFLTWQQDPTTTMTVDWHTRPEDRAISSLRFKEAGTGQWRTAPASNHGFRYSDRTIHRVDITGLKPDTLYRFQLGEFERIYAFRTMPDSIIARPLVFATGGDTRHRQDWMEQTNRAVMAFDLDFIAWGGDLAYCDGREDRLYRWYEWFDAIMSTLICEEGRVIPIVLAIGNHEMARHLYGSGHWSGFDNYEDTDEWRAEHAPYFSNLFAYPGVPYYNVLDFGDYMSLISLDTDHANPIAGAQTEWLKQVLAERAGRPHIFPMYHVPAYPSGRTADGETPSRIRENWVPLFERHGVRVAFENHDHTYKRTHPLRGGRIDPAGITYIGDGAWGVNIRQNAVSGDEWYINRFAEEHHAIIVTLHGTHQHYLMINKEGDAIDEFPRTAKRKQWILTTD